MKLFSTTRTLRNRLLWTENRIMEIQRELKQLGTRTKSHRAFDLGTEIADDVREERLKIELRQRKTRLDQIKQAIQRRARLHRLIKKPVKQVWKTIGIRKR